jgi:hypothetical protein
MPPQKLNIQQHTGLVAIPVPVKVIVVYTETAVLTH